MQDSNRSIVPARQTRGRSATRVKGEYLLFHCLIASSDVERQQMLTQAAGQNGWETTTCADIASAISYLRRGLLQLAIVDLVGDSTSDFSELFQQIAKLRDVLTIVCGNDGDAEEEVWARQMGAWLYLPGVNDATNVSLLCGEAKHVVERMHSASVAAETPQRVSMRRAQ